MDANLHWDLEMSIDSFWILEVVGCRFPLRFGGCHWDFFMILKVFGCRFPLIFGDFHWVFWFWRSLDAISLISLIPKASKIHKRYAHFLYKIPSSKVSKKQHLWGARMQRSWLPWFVKKPRESGKSVFFSQLHFHTSACLLESQTRTPFENMNFDLLYTYISLLGKQKEKER